MKTLLYLSLIFMLGGVLKEILPIETTLVEEPIETLPLEKEVSFTIEEISEVTLDRIQGISYKQEGIVPLEQLRYVKVLHYGFDGEIHTGEIIVNVLIAEDVVAIFEALYEAQYPIESIQLIDEFQGDDSLSMNANNSSGFNYRNIAGTDKLSNHSYGMAIDINPLYNPYVKKTDANIVCEPEAGRPYSDRSVIFPYKIDETDLCYQLFTKYGFTWGGSWKSIKDYQHFEKTP